MGEPMAIDVDENNKSELNNAKKCLKRKRASLIERMSKEDRESRLVTLREEMNGLFNYFKEILGVNKRVGLDLGVGGNSLIACLLEGSSYPLSKLADEIYEKVKDIESDVTLASVRSSVLLIGQRSFYGLQNVNADVLEDDSESCLWCWEARDMKLIPKSMCGGLKIWRTCRKKINERITAVSAMIAALEKTDNDQTHNQELIKASERLGKVLSESDIRLLIESMVQKNGADMVEKGGKREQNMLVKQMERNKREAEKQKKKFQQELQKEKLQNEKELKRLQDEAEKEEKRREKEESELRKQLKKQQEEAERDQRRREKEEAELKKQVALQKQATLMERFLKKSKQNTPSQKVPSPATVISTDLPCKRDAQVLESVTLFMDSALSQVDETETKHLWKLHLNSWRCLGQLIRTDRKQQWGIRRTPKTELIKELKLTSTDHCDEELSTEKLSYGWAETNSNRRECHTNIDDPLLKGQKRRRKKQLLQFDKSHRPAFYGTWPRESKVIKPRRPFVKDSELDYEIDSDEEWEEEEPGESLSDCDKDDEDESLEDGPSKAEEEDESEDGFFVPDGYLSENEGVQEDKTESDEDLDQSTKSFPSFKQVESEELTGFYRQQKYLHNLTESALRKSRPLIISNMLHEKVKSVNGAYKDISELEQTCLLALSMRRFPSYPSIEISLGEDVQNENLEASPSSNKGKTTPVAATTALPDSDLSEIVAIIQSHSQGINKLVESLHLKFPETPKSQLRIRVREISHFTDNRWQVKKDILNKLGMSPSPDSIKSKTKNIASFFSKRCLPPEEKTEEPVKPASQ